MKIKNFTEIAFLLMQFFGAAYSYEPSTHIEISAEAAKLSILNGVLTNLGLDKSIEDADQKLPNSEGVNRTILDLIKDGADFEDNGIRSVNHFYDPLHDRPLNILGAPLGSKSPDWALEDNRFEAVQDFSLKDARNYLYSAFTAPTKQEREKNFGLTFQTLGQVIHHIQDMAQPQHVRNDTHLDLPFTDPNIPFIENPSLYESYTNGRRNDLGFPYSGYDAVAFNSARSFWHTIDGQGIADYSNRGFVSSGTNFTGSSSNILPAPDFPLPNGIGATVITKQIDDPNLLGPDQPLRGEIDFISTAVRDHYQGSTFINPRTSSYSIFDADLENAGESRSFTLNRFNFDSAHQLLIRRAVGYSAGLINYFFRGRLAAEDPLITSTSIELKVTNAIDDRDPKLAGQILRGSTSSSLLVSYEFKLNGQDFVGTTNTVPLTEDIAPGKTSLNTYKFTLPAVANVADSADVKYQLVFRGQLGQETDAIAVGNIVLSPPGFLVIPNSLPPDGIAGTRLIYKSGNQWRLSKKAGFSAGNVDWKGWYVDGKPTKVLSWKGPTSRYFPPNDFSSGITLSYGAAIYQDGKGIIAPFPVIGAALMKDTEGREWIIAICTDDNSDIVYRKLNKKVTSGQIQIMSQPQNNWEEIGRLPTSEGTPWFFNGNGTEAQTIKSNKRLKVSIVNGATANFSIIDNVEYYQNYHPGSGGQSTISEVCGTVPFPVESSYDSSSNTNLSAGPLRFAVDYIDDKEIVATISRSATEIGEGHGYRFAASPDRGQNSGIGSYRVLDYATLSIGGKKINIYNYEHSEYLNGSTSVPGNSPPNYQGSYEATDTSEVKYFSYIDLRDSTLFYQVDEYNYTKSVNITDRTVTSSIEITSKYVADTKEGIFVANVVTDFFSDRGTGRLTGGGEAEGPYDELLEIYATSRVYIPCTTDTTTTTYDFSTQLADYRAYNSNGLDEIAFARDLQGNLFMSWKFIKPDNSSTIFNYLTGGNPNSITGIQSPDLSFSPVTLK